MKGSARCASVLMASANASPCESHLKIWAVVPVKALTLSKQRLAAILGNRRADFTRALLAQTLAALTGSRQISGILVVTADPQVANLAQQAGTEVLLQEANLNTACSA